MDQDIVPLVEGVTPTGRKIEFGSVETVIKENADEARQAGAEIEVTRDMILAGEAAAAGCDDLRYLDDWLPEIFRAMAAKAPRPAPVDQTQIANT